MHVSEWWLHVMRETTQELADECDRERDPRLHDLLELAMDCRSGYFLLVERNNAMKNWPLMFQTTEFILDHRSQWNQAAWVDECGTKFCFAGRACNLIGCKPVRAADPIVQRVMAHYGYMSSRELVTVPAWLQQEMPVKFWTRDREVQDSPVVHIRDAATTALRLTEAEAEILFHPDNELPDIVDFVTSKAADEHVELPLALSHFETSCR